MQTIYVMSENGSCACDAVEAYAYSYSKAIIAYNRLIYIRSKQVLVLVVRRILFRVVFLLLRSRFIL